jgi:hypothetical protein
VAVACEEALRAGRSDARRSAVLPFSNRRHALRSRKTPRKRAVSCRGSREAPIEWSDETRHARENASAPLVSRARPRTERGASEETEASKKRNRCVV